MNAQLNPSQSAHFEPQFELLPMRTFDLDEVLAVEYSVYAYPWGRGNFADSMSSGYSCWVCRVAEELIGYFVVMLAVDEAHLLNIAIASKRQGLGYGARLLREAMRVAQASGGTMMLLEVRPSNESALRLYRHFGFKQIGVRKGYYPAANGREDALVLTHDLAEVLA